MTAAAGIALALAAAALYAGGVTLQAADARLVSGRHAFRASLLTRLAARRRWLVGLALYALGWPFQIAALLVAPLVLVQAAVAAGLLLALSLLALARGEAPRRGVLVAMVAVVGGVAAVAWAVPSRSAEQEAAPLAIVLVVLGTLALAPYLSPRRSGRSAVLATASAGFAYAWSAIAAKLVADGFSTRSWPLVLLWLAAAALAAMVGEVGEMTALQRRPPHAVVPVLFTIELLAPLPAAFLAFQERWNGDAGAIVLVLALAALTAGTAVLARSGRTPARPLS